MNTTSRPTTFAVSSVEPATTALPEVTLGDLVHDLGGRVEACSAAAARVVCPVRRGRFPQPGQLITEPEQSAYPAHSLLQAAYLAFTQHRPLVLSPDMLWLTIAQGLAVHINQHAEELRPQFVAHAGRKLLTVRTERAFDMGPHPWPDYVESFSTQLRHNLGPAVHNLFVADFSTTGATERIACQIALMDGMQAYFGYELCECGIPSVTLEGTVDDWREIVRRARSLARFGLSWWTDRLVPVLEQFVRARLGDVNPNFWYDLYQQTLPGRAGAYHGPLETYSGWIGVFLPFDRDGQRNPLLTEPGRGVPLSDFGPGVCRAPVKWITSVRHLDLEFLAGLLAIEQNPHTLALRPLVGWAVRRAQCSRWN